MWREIYVGVPGPGNLKLSECPNICESSSRHYSSLSGLFLVIREDTALEKTMDTMDSQDGLKTIALPLFLNLFFNFLLQLLCVMISNWLTVLKHKMPSQILIKNTGLVW